MLAGRNRKRELFKNFQLIMYFGVVLNMGSPRWRIVKLIASERVGLECE